MVIEKTNKQNQPGLFRPRCCIQNCKSQLLIRWPIEISPKKSSFLPMPKDLTLTGIHSLTKNVFAVSKTMRSSYQACILLSFSPPLWGGKRKQRVWIWGRKSKKKIWGK